ncbi:uncharacterized protein TRAVEDRAFT_49740 [Trametes versicolor FP-101664 SS1]|uniref:uncharacterized protein n=1 Tax=Trametes versicolor (strain FP-101664) TaxID=717944 RepID=UPI00046233E0|nr:uncharacterized protein TRAVEDRAFT_49740 [Trametes versicolor FP-101664 SS1]EIW56929.1 hypothetical protein TRAVEDRAFT_49740 [Trametes versicolor FP-101664 SS1]
MSTRANTRKRARTGSISATNNDGGAHNPVEPEFVARKRDEEFWYPDGSIILVAGDIEFRVYKGILAKHSPVFEDMFSLPQPSDPTSSASSAQEVCPVVHLSDSPEDLRHVLRAYMPTGGPSVFFSKEPPGYSYDAISAAVRLGHKYQMSDLLDNALDYLKAYYPIDFDKWYAYKKYGPPSFTMAHHIGLVNLARLVDDAELLIMALLVCCTIDDTDIIHGFEREDGSREQLALGDIGLCYIARARLTAVSVQIMLRICHPEVADACKTERACSLGFESVLIALEAIDDPSVITNPDPGFDAIGFDDAFRAAGVCAQCKEMVKERNLRERKAAWEKLPEIFGIELPKAADEGQAAGNATPP